MFHARSAHLDVFLRFLKLGCLSFGGPVAHLGYFQAELVRRQRWLSEAEYADLVALCQFLPGPTSSQVGFALGYRRAGVGGAMLAWLGFTLPAAVLMLGFALGLAQLGDLDHAGWVVGLKLAAVAVVAQAIADMAGKLCPDRPRALLALLGAALLLLLDHPIWQLVVILIGAGVGWWRYRGHSTAPASPATTPPSRRGWPYLIAFALLLAGLPLAKTIWPDGSLAVVDTFYRTGSLVFGGGHVVLPLLDAATVEPGWVDHETFLAGYGAAQAMPGPLFAFSAFLGARLEIGPGGVFGGCLALVAIYLPSWLLVLGILPSWDRLREQVGIRSALMGTNAAVVGLLLAAFYQPIWTSTIIDADRLAFALVAFALLRFGRLPPVVVVFACAAGGAWLF